MLRSLGLALIVLGAGPALLWGQPFEPTPFPRPRFARELPSERSTYQEQAPVADNRSAFQQPTPSTPDRNGFQQTAPTAEVRPTLEVPPPSPERFTLPAGDTPALGDRFRLDQPSVVVQAAAETDAAEEKGSVITEGVEWVSAEAIEKVQYVWNLVITEVDGKAIRIGTVICGLILFTFGLFSSKLIAWWFGGRFLPRLGMHKSATAPVRSITYYVLLATFTMLALRLINVPLTAFTFLGGALAVGVGFGSQNLCNNFISGLILLAEQPIREGDSIQIDAYSGTVTKIGPRSTRITTGDNHEVIVPNSSFLQSNVVNRTLTDDRVRARIKLGVAYGSPTRAVERILLQAADEHEEVLEAPTPSVAFVDFGDNALQFELQFWVNCRSAKGETESDIRYRIDELFRQDGIVMAYPQRDVHLNVGQPVEVRLAGSPLSLVRELNRSAA